MLLQYYSGIYSCLFPKTKSSCTQVDGRQRWREERGKEEVMAGQEEDRSSAEKMMMGGQEGDIERHVWWLLWLNWDTHDPPSLIDVISSHGSTSYDLQDHNKPYFPPIDTTTKP